VLQAATWRSFATTLQGGSPVPVTGMAAARQLTGLHGLALSPEARASVKQAAGPTITAKSTFVPRRATQGHAFQRIVFSDASMFSMWDPLPVRRTYTGSCTLTPCLPAIRQVKCAGGWLWTPTAAGCTTRACTWSVRATGGWPPSTRPVD
jgi:hypothetical protein